MHQYCECLFRNSELDKIEEKLLSTICMNKLPLDIRSLSQEELERFNNAAYCKILHVKFKGDDRVKCNNLDHDDYNIVDNYVL